MRLLPVLIVALITTLYLACGGGSGDAESVAGGLFEAIKVGDMEKAATFYAREFFEAMPKDEWLEDAKGVARRLGDLQSYELENWGVTTYVGPSGSGTYWKMEYKVVYSKHSAKETLTLFKPAVGGELKIVGHKVSSPAFLRD